jgi:hypothetical protein
MSKPVSTGPRGDFVVVNLVLGYAMSMTEKQYDGTRTPPHPILFFTITGEDSPTTYPDREAAEQAITRTLSWSAAHGYGWQADEYHVWSLAAWEAIRAKRIPRRRARSSATPETATDA